MKKLLKKIVAIGLSAAMTFGMAVTSFAEETTENTTVAVTGVTLDVEELSLFVGDTYELKATVEPEDATTKTVTFSVAEADQKYVTVSDKGVITAVKATEKDKPITVTATASEKTATCKVTVKDQILNVEETVFADSAKTMPWYDGGNNVVYVNGGKVKEVPTWSYKTEVDEKEVTFTIPWTQYVDQGELVVEEVDTDGDGEADDEVAKVQGAVDVNYKQITLYSTLVPETIKVKGKDKAGKLTAFVTLDKNATPIVNEKGKITKVKIATTTGEGEEAKTTYSDKDVSKDDTKAAKNVASASVKSKNGETTITVKAGKAEGRAYVWIVDVRADKTAGQMVCIPVDVYAAPKSVLLFGYKTVETEKEVEGEKVVERETVLDGVEYETKTDEEGKTTTTMKSIDKKKAVKKVTLNVGESIDYRIFNILNLKTAPFVTKTAENFEVTVDEKGKAFVDAYVESDTLVIRAKAIDSAKPTKAAKAKVTVINKFNNKKASITVTVVNDVIAVNGEATITLPDASEDKKTVEIAYSDAQELTAGWNISTYATDLAIAEEEVEEGKESAVKLPYQTTDKIKLYVTSDEKAAETKDNVTTTYGYKVENVKGKDKFTLTSKSKDVSAKLAKDGKITLTVKKGVAEAKGKLLIVCTHVDKTIDVYEVIFAAAPSVKVDKSEVTVEEGKTDIVTVTAANGAEDATVTVKSEAEATATATISEGKITITGVKAGDTKVTVTYGEGDAAVKTEITVKVTAAAAAQS